MRLLIYWNADILLSKHSMPHSLHRQILEPPKIGSSANKAYYVKKKTTYTVKSPDLAYPAF